MKTATIKLAIGNAGTLREGYRNPSFNSADLQCAIQMIATSFSALSENRFEENYDIDAIVIEYLEWLQAQVLLPFYYPDTYDGCIYLESDSLVWALTYATSLPYSLDTDQIGQGMVALLDGAERVLLTCAQSTGCQIKLAQGYATLDLPDATQEEYVKSAIYHMEQAAKSWKTLQEAEERYLSEHCNS